MKKIFLTMLVVAFFFGSVYSQSITVLSPNGGENLKIGQKYFIKWKSSGIIGSSVGIKLFFKGSGLGYIKQNVPNSGVYSWTIDSIIGYGKIKPGVKYQIQVKKSGVTGDLSNGFFTISDNSVTPTITVVNPSQNPGLKSVWNKKYRYQIMWLTKGNIYNTVKIRLYDKKGLTKVLGITNGVSTSAGSYLWTIPNSIKNDDYRIRVVTTDNKAFADSRVFTITDYMKPSIKILNPDQGTVWIAGNKYNVKWEAKGAIFTESKNSKVTIEIFKDSVKDYNKVFDESSIRNDGLKEIKVPDNLKTGIYYLRISHFPFNHINSISKPFTIKMGKKPYLTLKNRLNNNVVPEAKSNLIPLRGKGFRIMNQKIEIISPKEADTINSHQGIFIEWKNIGFNKFKNVQITLEKFYFRGKNGTPLFVVNVPNTGKYRLILSKKSFKYSNYRYRLNIKAVDSWEISNNNNLNISATTGFFTITD